MEVSGCRFASGDDAEWWKCSEGHRKGRNNPRDPDPEAPKNSQNPLTSETAKTSTPRPGSFDQRVLATLSLPSIPIHCGYPVTIVLCIPSAAQLLDTCPLASKSPHIMLSTIAQMQIHDP